jgi:serine/threonine-protein kinase HipA
MNKVKRIKAFLNVKDSILLIGEMVLNEQIIYFKYDDNFIKSGLEISPFKMKRSDSIIHPKETHFDGLFGVFSDSLPDGWGKLLMDKHFISQGVDLNSVTALDRLAMIDDNSMGAIKYEPHLESEHVTNPFINLDTIHHNIEKVIKGSSEDVLSTLFQLGGSSGGARPKIIVGYNPVTDEIIHGMSHLPNGFEHWIIKFPSSNDIEGIALVEFAYNQMAKKAGIEVNDFKLFKSQNGNYFFGSKRFDRVGNQKMHLHSVAGLLHDNFRQSTLDYGHIMDCAYRLEKDVAAYSKVIRLATFNVLAHNRDDHSKNFSFLMNHKGEWKFAPAYDLTYSSSSFGMHSTAVAGESKNPTTAHIKELANHFGVTHINEIIEEVKEAVLEFHKLANQLELNKETIKIINSKIDKI